MMTIFNYFCWGEDPDEKDSATGLTRRDVNAIQKTCQRLYADPISNGMGLFVKLFRAEPETQNFFDTIKGFPEEKFTVKRQFKAHVLYFMSLLNLAVTNLHQPEIVAPLMYKLGKTHKRFGIQPKHFHTLSDVLIDTLKNSLQESDDVIATWIRFVTFIYKPLFEGLAEE